VISDNSAQEDVTTDEPQHWVLDTRPLLNFTATGSIRLLQTLLGTPIGVPAEVHREWKQTVAAAEGRLRSTPVSRHDPADVRMLTAFQNTTHCFDGNPFCVVHLYDTERNLAIELERDQQAIHPGEAAALAMCIHRGAEWAVVLDDRPAHAFALQQGIHTVGTLDLLVRGVRAGHLELDASEALFSEIQRGWRRAPRGRLAEYVAGDQLIWNGE